MIEKEMKNILPNGWIELQLRDLISDSGVFSDGDWVESKDQDANGDIRLIQLSDIGDGVFLDKSRRFLTKKRALELKCLFLQKGDVLISRLGDPLGKSCIYPDLKMNAVTAVDICVFRPNNQYILPKLVMNSLNASYLRSIISSQSSGTTRKRITGKKLKVLNFKLPPINEQKRIVDKIEQLFSDLDKGEDLIKTIQKQLKTYLQSALKSAVTGELTKDWREKNQAKLKSGEDLLKFISTQYYESLSNNKKNKFNKLDSSNLPKLPSSWVWTNIEMLCDNKKHSIKAGPFGSSLKKEFYSLSGYKIYGQEQVISGDPFYGDYYVNEQKYKELESCKTKENDILISLVGTIGKVLILPKNAEKGIINPRLVKISPNIEIYNPFFFKYYFESGFLKSLYKLDAHGATMDVLNLGIIKRLPFILCSIEEQNEIVSLLDDTFSQINILEKWCLDALKESKYLRQSILKSAFSGKLVPQDPNDEPASKLLEKIKAAKQQLENNKPTKKKK